MNYPRVSIIVLNWNGWRAAIRCLESLYQITYPSYDVILVDNGSEDDSVEKIKEWAEGKIPVESKFFQYNPEGKPIRYIEYERGEAEAGGSREEEISRLPSNKKLILIKNEQNYGFPKGNNIGIRYALKALNPNHFCLLHHDTVVAPNFLDELVNVANKEPGAGILGAKLFYYDEPDRILSAGYGVINYWTGTFPDRGAGQIDRGQFEDVVEVDCIATCGVLISRELWQTIGLLDEAFFWGKDEVDLCIRAAKQGFKVLFVPKSEVWHDYKQKPRHFSRYTPKGRLILMQKHWSKLQFASAILFFMAPYVKAFFLWLLYSRNWNNLKYYSEGLLEFLKERKSYKREKDHR